MTSQENWKHIFKFVWLNTKYVYMDDTNLVLNIRQLFGTKS